MKDKKKFCFILPSFFFEEKGGAELQCYYIAQELIKRGWEVHYIRENNNKFGIQEEIDGVQLHALPERTNALSWTNIIKLRNIMEQIHADAWYCRARPNCLAPVVKNAKGIGGKVLWACSHDNQLRFVIPRNLSGAMNLMLDYPNRFAFTWALCRADEIILQTDYQRKLLRNRYRMQGTVIHNAHPIPSVPITERESIVLWVGRLQSWKHPEKFINIAKSMAERSYKFIAIGRPLNNGIEGILHYYDKILRNFCYLGELSNFEVNRYMERAKLLVNTSDYEGFSNTFIEAWLRGVPVVSLSVDPDDMIKEHGLGKVSGNIEQMPLDVNEMMENEYLWKKMSAQAQKFARKKFNIVNSVSKLETLIEHQIH